MSTEQQQVLFANTARAMGDAPEAITIHHITHCFRADPTPGAGVASAREIPLDRGARQRCGAPADTRLVDWNGRSERPCRPSGTVVPNSMLLEKDFQLGKPQRPAEKIALKGVAALPCQYIALLCTFDSFGDYRETEAFCQRYDRTGY